MKGKKKMAQTKRAPWPKIGTLRKGDTGSYIKLEENVQVLVDGKPIAMNKSRTVRLEDPRKKVESMVERGVISEAEGDKRLEKLSEMEWLRYELVVAPPKPE